MKVAALVLLVAVVGLFMAGSVSGNNWHQEKTAVATANADASAFGKCLAITATCTQTCANTCGCCVTAGSSSDSLSIAK